MPTDDLRKDDPPVLPYASESAARRRMHTGQAMLLWAVAAFFGAILIVPGFSPAWSTWALVPGLVPFGLATAGMLWMYCHRGLPGWRGTTIVLFMVWLASYLLARTTCDAIRDRQRQALFVLCRANLRCIGQAVYVYADEHGACPPDLATLIGRDLITPAQCQCPFDANKDARKHDYVYVPGRTLDSDPNGILAYEPPGMHPGGGDNVLFCDGHVDWLDASKLRNTMSRLRQAARQPLVSKP